MSVKVIKQGIFDRKTREKVAHDICIMREITDTCMSGLKNTEEFKKLVVKLIEAGSSRYLEDRKIALMVSIDAVVLNYMELIESSLSILVLTSPPIPLGGVLAKQINKTLNRLKENGVRLGIRFEEKDNINLSYLLRISDIMVFNPQNLSNNNLSYARDLKKTVFLKGVNSFDIYLKTMDLVDLVQGNYVEKPSLITGELLEINPLKTTLLKIFNILNTTKDLQEIAKYISADIGLSTKLLKYVNSPLFPTVKEITTVLQACSFLGITSIKKFLVTFAITQSIEPDTKDIWKKSFVRAFICESLASFLLRGSEHEAYMMGLFSLFDRILGEDAMSYLEDELKLDKKILDGIAGRDSVMARILRVATILEESYEASDYMAERSPVYEEVSQETRITPEELYRITKEAFSNAEFLFSL